LTSSSISDLVGEVYRNSDNYTHPGPNTNDTSDKGKKEKKNYDDEEQLNQKSKFKRRYLTYKYSIKGKGPLHEAVILKGVPVFVRYENGQIESIPQTEESSRIIKPPDPEEYPYEAYEFKIMDEVLSYVEKAKTESIDSLYQKAKSIVKKYTIRMTTS
jgi:hypothetical protein